ncbi:MAG: ABC transporter ATP-binding protein/permease [Actinobacteria bacterium]|nr:ABC transporter ATP-binding protein/permease [Actinomycetota bacterium]
MIPVRAYWRLLSEYLRPLRGRVALLGTLLLLGITFQAVNPQLIKGFLDRVQTDADLSILLSLASGYILLAVGHQVLTVISTYLAEQVGWTATNELRARLADHVLRLDMGFHKTTTPGELIERIDGDVTTLSNFFSKFVIYVAGNVVLIVTVLFLLWREAVQVGFWLTVFAVGAMLMMIRVQAFAMPWWKKVRARSAEFHGFVGEQLGGTEDVRANGAVPFMMHRFTRIVRAWLPEAVRARMGFAALWATGILSYIVGVALVFWLGWRMVGDGRLTIGSVYLIFHYTEMIRHPMDQIREQMSDLQKAGAGIERVSELFARRSAIDGDGGRALPDGALSLSFDRLGFHYEDEASDGELVLDDIHLDIGAGRVVGVLGRTGSGKSTLARLLTRLYDPQHGDLRLGGVPVREADIGDLRLRVGMVTQEVQLFRATVRDNMTFFDPSIDDERLWEVLFSLGLGDWVAGLPDALDTMLETGGAGLSAGQAQLLALARIFLRDPGLVILDEASSRLDPATEMLIDRAVGRLLDGRTGVIIAHRLATVERADDILILDGGRVAEFGERAALAADPGSRLSRLLETGMEDMLA